MSEGLDLYEVIQVDGKEYVRKELLDRLQQQLDAAFEEHTAFVDEVFAGVMQAKAEGRLLPR